LKTHCDLLQWIVALCPSRSKNPGPPFRLFGLCLPRGYPTALGRLCRCPGRWEVWIRWAQQEMQVVLVVVVAVTSFQILSKHTRKNLPKQALSLMATVVLPVARQHDLIPRKKRGTLSQQQQPHQQQQQCGLGQGLPKSLVVVLLLLLVVV
jgi:hypothetical protein